MGESTILRIVVNQEEIMLLEAAMRLEKTAGQHTKAFRSPKRRTGIQYCSGSRN